VVALRLDKLLKTYRIEEGDYPLTHNSMQKHIQTSLIVLFIVILVGGIGITYTWTDKVMSEVQNQPRGPFVSQPTQSHSDQIAAWKTYHNEKYGFIIKYPPEFYIDVENNAEVYWSRIGKPNLP
jgi:hypothetical protein